MKVAVYTIALNEAAHVARWARSAADADYRVVADTGSSDDTPALLAAEGVAVHRLAIRPWRFDDARNAALALLPADADVCLSMDMDEFLEPGWRPKLEAAWQPGVTTALFCRLALRHSVDDPAPRVWPAMKFHRRWGYRFHRPVHEALICVEGQPNTPSSDILIHHIQDRSKGTRRQYLPLLELAHREDPNDSQIAFWLGRDLMWAGRHAEGAAVMERYLALPGSTWREERTEAMRCLARMQPEKRLDWLDRARRETPHRREIWHDLAEAYHDAADWANLFWACLTGIERTHRTGSYLDDPSVWGFRLYDLGAIAAWHLNAMDRAVDWGKKALEFDSGNERQRLENNLGFFLRRRDELHASA
jgi:glycosyltransferase involved in cell wall biosynthesis